MLSRKLRSSASGRILEETIEECGQNATMPDVTLNKRPAAQEQQESSDRELYELHEGDFESS